MWVKIMEIKRRGRLGIGESEELLERVDDIRNDYELNLLLRLRDEK